MSETPNPPLYDKYVACPFQIQMCDQQGGIGLGSAFFYELEGETFIITNWHNITGKDPMTGDPLHRERSPLYMRAKLAVVTAHDAGQGTTMLQYEAQRIDIEDDGNPLWFEHPTLGSLCDVVAIPFQRPANWPPDIHRAANRIDEEPIPVIAGLKAIVIGFPQGLSSGPGLPIMKTGFIASVPGQRTRLGGTFSDVGGMKDGTPVPAMLVDVHTVPGMSGSPVFGEYSGVWNPENLGSGVLTSSSKMGVGRMFLGCHSSRVPGLEERSGLALCHGKDVIENICQARHPGQRFPREDTGYTYD